MLTFSAQPLGEVGERLPLGGVHVHVLSVVDVLVVDDVVVHSLGSCRENNNNNNNLMTQLQSHTHQDNLRGIRNSPNRLLSSSMKSLLNSLGRQVNTNELLLLLLVIVVVLLLYFRPIWEPTRRSSP